MSTTVAIFGSGIAGLTAAHELVQRGFTVTVYEGDQTLGGKSASQVIPGTGAGGRADLRGEHGFRFYPGFYRHLIATLFEIPRPTKGYVTEDLCESNQAAIAFNNGTLVKLPRRLDGISMSDIAGIVRGMYGDNAFATDDDLALASWYRLKFMTAGHSRRADEYERISWSKFLELDTQKYSAAFKEFERSVPRTLSAMVADKSSAHTVGTITMQFLLGYVRPKERADAVMNGPTSVRWLEPWVHFLKASGVAFHASRRLDKLVRSTANPSKIDHAEILDAASNRTNVTADYYVGALPLERMQDVITNSGLQNADPGITDMMQLVPATTTDWMAGAQYFLTKDLAIVEGHVFYPDSEWALSSISQAQFWRQSGREIDQDYGDGNVKEVLSVAVSDWNMVSQHLKFDARNAGMYNPAAPGDVILDEVFRQLQNALGAGVLRSADVYKRHLDTKITFDAAGVATNATPLLIHPMGSYHLRPNARLQNFDNFVLASDYVKTYTQLASMEGANEAARHAVNAILDVEGSAEPECTIWPFVEEVFESAREMDDQRYAQGLPHIMDDAGGPAPMLTLLELQDKLLGDPVSLLL